MGELSPAKLLRIGPEARSPSSRVEVGRVEEVHYGTSDRLRDLSKGQGERCQCRAKRDIQVEGYVEWTGGMAKSECSHGEGDNNRNLIPSAHGRSPTHSRLQRLGFSSNLIHAQPPTCFRSPSRCFPSCRCEVQVPSLMTSSLLNVFISLVLLFLANPMSAVSCCDAKSV